MWRLRLWRGLGLRDRPHAIGLQRYFVYVTVCIIRAEYGTEEAIRSKKSEGTNPQ